MKKSAAYFHLPGLFEFFDFYKVFLPVFFEHKEWFHEWCHISSIYGSPSDCLWAGGRVGFGQNGIHREVFDLCQKYGISARLTFSNSLLQDTHLTDKKCNELCRFFQKKGSVPNGIILHSDLLLDYLKKNYPEFYFVSSTTKVLTDFKDFEAELSRPEFSFVVPDFRLNKDFSNLQSLSQSQKDKTEFLLNECCWIKCNQRKMCYENVSKKALGIKCPDHKCTAPEGNQGYVFSKAMKNPAFISLKNIQETYLPMGFSNFKIEGRSLGSALILEFLLYYMTKPEYQLCVREAVYLDNTLDLF